MNLRKKKLLAAKVLKVGKNRISFDESKLSEIKEAITKRDILDLHKEGIILIKEIKGGKKKKKKKTKKGPGKIKKKINRGKQTYVKLTRKLRNYLKELKMQGQISNELYWSLRKRIKMRDFKSKSHLKENLQKIEKIDLEKGEIKSKLERKETKKKEKKKTREKAKKSKEKTKEKKEK